MKKIQPVLLLLLYCSSSWAQTENYHASVEAQGVLTTRDHVPFWLRADRFGSIPLPGTSGSLIASARKDYSKDDRLVDWGASLQVRGDQGTTSRLTLIEGYAKARLSIFELKAGRDRDFTGLVDSTLSSGSFAVSGNALGIPKVQLSIPEFWTLPIFGGLFAAKGSFSYGWFGEVPVQSSKFVKSTNAYYHQLTFYGRLGKPDWRLKLYGGFNHQVMWGDEKSVTGPAYKLSPFKTFEYVVLGRTYQGSKVGNHIGSIDLAMNYQFDGVKLSVYRQNFYDEGALAKLANIADGLNGISLTNTIDEDDNEDDDGFHSNKGLRWHKVVLELFYSKDQAGYPWSKPTKSGDENYYNNYEYTQGWSYKGLALGNPFITPYPSTRAGLPNDHGDYFNNNRVVALYAGMQGSFNSIRFTVKGSYSFNYGTFGTSKWGHSTGRSFYRRAAAGLSKELRQFSALVDVTKDLSSGWTAGCTAALDKGGLFYDTYGLILSLKKDF
jgi:hypothetical protein